jgi:hypothetical protein
VNGDNFTPKGLADNFGRVDPEPHQGIHE